MNENQIQIVLEILSFLLVTTGLYGEDRLKKAGEKLLAKQARFKVTWLSEIQSVLRGFPLVAKYIIEEIAYVFGRIAPIGSEKKPARPENRITSNPPLIGAFILTTIPCISLNIWFLTYIHLPDLGIPSYFLYSILIITMLIVDIPLAFGLFYFFLVFSVINFIAVSTIIIFVLQGVTYVLSRLRLYGVMVYVGALLFIAVKVWQYLHMMV